MLLVEDFKSAIIDIFLKLKDIISEELKGSVRITSHWTENINKETEIIRKSK